MRLRLIFPLCAASILFGCKHNSDASPACYSGIILGQTCMDGVIIQVDARTPIGLPIRAYQTSRDSLVSTNAVAAVNDLGNLYVVGKPVYFTYIDSPNNQGPIRFCTQNTTPLPIPHLVLSNVSAAPCEPVTP